MILVCNRGNFQKKNRDYLMNKEACDVFDKVPNLKMLFQKTPKCPYFISLVIL